MAPEIKAFIDDAIKANKVMIFMKGTPDFPQCGFSAATVECFARLGCKFATADVLASPELRTGIKEYSQWPTIPQVYIDGEFVGGCDITREMFENGELEQAVRAAGAAA
jgi:monothiol glutaredoxin